MAQERAAQVYATARQEIKSPFICPVVQASVPALLTIAWQEQPLNTLKPLLRGSCIPS